MYLGIGYEDGYVFGLANVELLTFEGVVVVPFMSFYQNEIRWDSAGADMVVLNLLLFKEGM